MRTFSKGIFILFLIISSCSHRLTPTTAKVNYLSSSDGTITMRAIGNGENQQEAITNAEKNSFEVLFFRGLPGSEQKIALIGINETEAKQKYQSYFDKFYNEQRYKTFLLSSIPANNLMNNGRYKSIAVDIKINVTALRKDLEQFNVIRKFGY